MNLLADIFASSGAGAIVGLLGSWLTKREERRNLEIKLTHDANMADIRRQEAAIESEHELAMADKQVERAQIEGAIALNEAEVSAFKEGLKEQQVMYQVKWVDGIRGLMRPLITLYLLVLATYITWQIGNYIGGVKQLDKDIMSQLYTDTIMQIFFLVTTAVTWWFGSRPSSARR